MKKILLSLLIPSIGVCGAEFLMNKDDVTFMPQAQITKIMNEPEWLIAERAEKKKQMEEKGYYEKDNRYAEFLLTLKFHAKDEIRSYRGTQFKEDTHLKSSPTEINLAFNFKQLPINNKNIIGYAPIGSYINKPKEGWNGIKVFFEDNEIGICAYEFTDLALSHGGILALKEENLPFIVGNKPTTLVVEGSKKTGFIYSVIWNDKLKRYAIDCAKSNYHKSVIDKIIALANKIDQR